MRNPQKIVARRRGNWGSESLSDARFFWGSLRISFRLVWEKLFDFLSSITWYSLYLLILILIFVNLFWVIMKLFEELSINVLQNFHLFKGRTVSMLTLCMSLFYHNVNREANDIADPLAKPGIYLKFICMLILYCSSLSSSIVFFFFSLHNCYLALIPISNIPLLFHEFIVANQKKKRKRKKMMAPPQYFGLKIWHMWENCSN